MTTFVPNAERLLQAAVDYLDAELLSTLEGYHHFQLRICVNTLRIVAREMVQAPALEQQEQERLQHLLGHAGSVAELNGEINDRIANGQLPLDALGLAEHLRDTLRGALAINNPTWITRP
ncbi:MAG: hypothetical protein DCF26_03145 [Burkholderiales bacterium]|nr:MAG: hypothetical protein DCF26_03145 [Burkholderiales bacterium]